MAQDSPPDDLYPDREALDAPRRGPMSARAAVPYQATLRTTRTRHQIIEDLVTLDVPGASVAEHSDTYLVFAPRRRKAYTAGRATAAAIVFAVAVLILTAANVVWIVLLPLALVAYLPLLIGDHQLLAIGVIDDDEIGVTRFTVHGHAWGHLKAAIDAYMSHLPEAPPEAATPARSAASVETGMTASASTTPPR